MTDINADIDDVMAAFADGERVGADALDQALADPAGRAYLIDVLVLREVVNGRDATPRVVLGSARSAAGAPKTGMARATWFAAAAMLVASLGAGFTVGWRAGEDRARSFAALPEPHLIALPATTVEAPAPTRIIRFQAGVDWQETAGGN